VSDQVGFDLQDLVRLVRSGDFRDDLGPVQCGHEEVQIPLSGERGQRTVDAVVLAQCIANGVRGKIRVTLDVDHAGLRGSPDVSPAVDSESEKIGRFAAKGRGRKPSGDHAAQPEGVIPTMSVHVESRTNEF